MKAGRILGIASSLPRWAGDTASPFVLNLARDLQAFGWRVDLLAPHAPGTATRETLEGVHIERFRYLWPERQQNVCYQGGGALVNLRAHPFIRLKLPLLLTAQWAAVARRLATRRYDLLHSHWILPQGFVGMLTCPFVGIPHVVTVHGSDIFGLRGTVNQHLKRAVLRHADAVTVNSRFTENAVRQLEPRSKRLVHIPMGVECDPPNAITQQEARTIRARYRRGDGPLLIFVGRLIEEKGAADLINAVDRLRQRLPNVTAIIIGDGPERARLEQLTHALALDDQITFSGWVDPAEIQAWLVAADTFVGPSRRAPNGGVESQGLTFLEAMVAGTAVIATRLGGIPDAVIHGQTGLLVDEGEPGQIADAVCQLINDPALKEHLIVEAQEHVSMHFSRFASSKKFTDLFHRLCSFD